MKGSQSLRHGDELEDRLRKALRPVDPEEGFAERVMSRIDSALGIEAVATPLAATAVRWLPGGARGVGATGRGS